jgi:hypothetical protein
VQAWESWSTFSRKCLTSCPSLYAVLIVHRLGKELTTTYQTLAHADDEIIERAALISSIWIQTREQLQLIDTIWSTFSEDHRAIHARAFTKLREKLESSNKKLNGFLKKRKGLPSDEAKPKVKRWKYFFLKPCLDETIRSLEKWQKMYDPTWYLIVRMESRLIDAELNRQADKHPSEAIAVRKKTARIRGVVRGDTTQEVHVSLPSNVFQDARFFKISCSSAKYMKRTGKSGMYIVDSIPCLDGAFIGQVDKDIRLLATKLHCADPSTFSVLKCRGMVKMKSSNGSRTTAFQLVFDVPSPGEPRSLRNYIALNTPHTLTERVDVAKQLARSVSFMHTLDFVHKNIRPENFIGFDETGLGSFYLAGFEHVRSADGITQYRSDADWHKNIYRHPERQGRRIEEKYRMQHDIYSLGVCLLEVGLWKTLVLYGADGKIRSPNTELFRSSIEELRRKKPIEIKDLLVDMARNDLAPIVGDLYKGVVLNCLTCLDEDNLDFGDNSEFEDADGIAIGVRFIEKVCHSPAQDSTEVC